MVNKRKVKLALIVAILFVSSITGTVFYYNRIVNGNNSEMTVLNHKIINLKDEIPSLNSNISSLKSQVSNLTSPHLVATITTQEYSGILVLEEGSAYNYVEITGSVTNTGGGTAFNAGLHVVGHYSDANVTVPLDSGASFGTDKATDAYGGSSLKLGSLDSGQTATISIDIYHEGTVSGWTVTPVWTNIP